MRRNKVMGAISVSLAILASVFMGSSAASAAETKSIEGFTQTEFVKAAVGEGTTAAVATKAWGDYPAMAKIAVAGDLTSSPELSTTQPLGPQVRVATRESFSGWCQKASYNVFGGLLMSLRVTSYWTSGPPVGAHQSAVSTQEGWGWSFTGINLSQDYYPEASHGSFISQRQGHWSGMSGSNANVSVSLRGYSTGSKSCSSSGGV